jgi:hypothetical protein
MNKLKMRDFAPGTVPTLDNWPSDLRMPPLRRVLDAPATHGTKAEAGQKVPPLPAPEPDPENVLWVF